MGNRTGVNRDGNIDGNMDMNGDGRRLGCGGMGMCMDGNVDRRRWGWHWMECKSFMHGFNLLMVMYLNSTKGAFKNSICNFIAVNCLNNFTLSLYLVLSWLVLLVGRFYCLSLYDLNFLVDVVKLLWILYTCIVNSFA